MIGPRLISLRGCACIANPGSQAKCTVFYVTLLISDLRPPADEITRITDTERDNSNLFDRNTENQKLTQEEIEELKKSGKVRGTLHHLAGEHGLAGQAVMRFMLATTQSC